MMTQLFVVVMLASFGLVFLQILFLPDRFKPAQVNECLFSNQLAQLRCTKGRCQKEHLVEGIKCRNISYEASFRKTAKTLPCHNASLYSSNRIFKYDLLGVRIICP